jgi:undecaprenyl-diphosphatase
LLGLPTLTAATLYKLAKNLQHAHETSTPNLFVELGAMNCLIACIVAAISAAIAVRWLVGFVSRGGLAKLGWYRIALCITLMVLLERGYVTFGKNGSERLNTQSTHVEPLGNP